MKIDVEDDDEPIPSGVQRIKLPPEPKQERQRLRDRDKDRDRDRFRNRDRDREADETKLSKKEDLRKIITRRKASPATKYSDSEEEEDGGNMSSVVRLPTRQDRPKRSEGTGRLLQKAILDIHGTSKCHKVATKRETRPKEEKKPKRKPSIVATKRRETIQEEVVEPEGFVDEFREESADPPDTTQYEEEEEEEGEVPTVTQTVQTPVDSDTLLTKKEVATLVAIKRVLPQQQLGTSDLRQVLNKKEKTTRFVVTIDGAADKYKNIPADEEPFPREQPDDDEDDDGTSNRAFGERCRFWPNCKNGDTCPYHHPTIPCRLFPNCKYGQKCCFVHPVCKFDGRCMKPGCPYLHTVPTNKLMQPNMLPLPIVPQYRPVGPYSYGSASGFGRGRGRFPNKASLTWTPEKSTSDRNFVVPDSQTTSMPVQ